MQGFYSFLLAYYLFIQTETPLSSTGMLWLCEETRVGMVDRQPHLHLSVAKFTLTSQAADASLLLGIGDSKTFTFTTKRNGVHKG